MTTAPAIVNNPNGTVSINGATVSYTVDPTRKFRIMTTCNHSTRSFDGKTRSASNVYKDSIVEVSVLISPLPSTLVTGTSYQVWRSADIMFTWDHSKLEFIEAVADPMSTDKFVVDVAKINATVVEPGKLHFHSQALPVPEARTPPLKPQYFQWNFGGFLWNAGNRQIGKLRFRVKSDFHYPTNQPTDIVAVPQLTKSDGTVINSQIDGSPALGSNVIGDIQNNANRITSGPSPAYKVSLSLVPPTTSVKVGDTVPVKIMVKPETFPQVIWSVSTIFSWDPTKLEFMGIDKTGSKASMSSKIDTSAASGTINESAVPKDGNAQHTWLGNLGDKAPIDKETQIVTLNFKAVSDFIDTSVNIIDMTDPRMFGAVVLDDTGVLGSCVPGVFVTGNVNHALVKGVLPSA